MQRRKFLRLGLAATAATIAAPALARDKAAVRYRSNPELPTLRPAAEWPGTPQDADGKFFNPDFPDQRPGRGVLKWMAQRNPQRQQKKTDPYRVPVLKTDAWLTGPADVVVWLGHASFFIRLNGVAVLIDPVFGRLPTGKRLTELPLDPARFTVLDYILVSHAHYDHCDKASLRQLHAQNPKAPLLCGLGLDKLLRRWLPGATVQPAGWYQQYATGERLKISFLPTRHWANRGLADVNETLWGAFVLQGGGRQVYFGGDSGYGPHGQQVAKLFPGLDVALLGAGAYAPRGFMHPNHQDPAQAVQAFRDCGAKRLVPMHFGTFDLSDEPPGEPAALLRSEETAGRLRPGELALLRIGEALGF